MDELMDELMDKRSKVVRNTTINNYTGRYPYNHITTSYKDILVCKQQEKSIKAYQLKIKLKQARER